MKGMDGKRKETNFVTANATCVFFPLWLKELTFTILKMQRSSKRDGTGDEALHYASTKYNSRPFTSYTIA